MFLFLFESKFVSDSLLAYQVTRKIKLMGCYEGPKIVSFHKNINSYSHKS